MAQSLNGFSFSVAVNNTGEQITVVAHKDDHEERRTVVFTFSPVCLQSVVNELGSAMIAAKKRRKAIRKAVREAAQFGEE